MRPLEADQIEQAQALAVRQPPEQEQTPGIDQGPVYGKPRRRGEPRRRRRSPGERGRDQRLRADRAR